MRPSSSNKNKKSPAYKRPQSAVKRKSIEQSPASAFSSSNVRSYKNNGQEKRYQDKIVLCNSAKKIAMIHAYQPKKLKQCLVSNSRCYSQFYYQNSGLCMISNLYTVSFMAHFRQWKKSLREKLSSICNSLLNLQSLDVSNHIDSVLNEISQFSQSLKSQTDIVSKQKELNLSKEASDLNKKFAYLRQYAKQLLLILRAFCEATKHIIEILQQVLATNKDVAGAIHSIKETEQNFQKNTFSSMSYCASHPQSAVMQNMQYHINQTLGYIIGQSNKILKKVMLVDVFKKKLQSVTTHKSKAEEYTVEALQSIIAVLGEHQEQKLKFEKNSNIQKLDKFDKFEEMIRKVQEKLNNLASEFLDNFKNNLEPILEYEYSQISKEKVEICLETKDSKFKVCKKKILLLTKIFNKKLSPQTYEKLSKVIKQTSQNYQEMAQVISKLQKISKQGVNHSKSDLSSTLNELANLIERFQENRDKILEGIEKCLGQNLRQYQSQPKESERLRKLQKLIHLDDNYLKEALAVPNDPVSSQAVVKKQQVLKLVEKNYTTLKKLSTQKFPQIEIASTELSQLFNDSLVSKFLTLSGDIKRDPIYSFWIFTQFTKKLATTLQTNTNRDISRQTLQNLHTFYAEYVSKCQAYKNNVQGVKYLHWVFENVVVKMVMNYISDLEEIVDDPVNNQYQGNQDKYANFKERSYNKNLQIRKYVDSRRKIIQYILISSNQSKYIKNKSLYALYLKQLLKSIQQMTDRQAIFQKLEGSAQSGSFSPDPVTLLQWIRFEFSYFIEGTISRPFINNHRKQVLGLLKYYIKRIQQITKQPKQKNLLGKNFIDTWTEKISNIEKFLIPFAEVTASVDINIKKYSQLVGSILKYLRASKVYHVGIFFGNQEPFTFFLGKYQGDCFSYYMRLFESMLKVPVIENDEAGRMFMPFQIQQKSQPTPAKAVVKQKSMFVLEESINNEDVVDDVQMLNPSFILSVIQPSGISEQKEKKLEKPYLYYKVTLLGSLNKLVECLKSAKVAPNLIKNVLKYQKLSLAFEQKQPNSQLCDHLQNAIKQLKKNNLMEIFNRKDKPSEAEQILLNLLKALKSTSKPAEARKNRYQCLKSALSLIGYSFNFLYDEGTEGNKIIMCHNENHQNYVYTVLINENPQDKSQLIKDEETVKIQTLFLTSLFSIPFQKNRNLDQIKSSIKQVKIESFKQLRNDLLKFKQHKPKNAAQAEEKIKKYLSSKSKQITLTSPNTIDYATYKQFLKEYDQIFGMQKGQGKLYRAYFDGKPELPICYSRKQQEIKNMLEPKYSKERIYSIIPRQYYNSTYIERSTYEITAVKISTLVNNIVKNQLQTVKQFYSKKSLALLYSIGQSNSQISSGGKKISNVFTDTKIQQYNILENSYRLIGQKDPIKPMLQTLSKYKDFENKLQKICSNRRYFILQDNQRQQQEEYQFMVNVNPVFIIGKSKKQIIFDSTQLEQINLILKQSNVQTRVIRYHQRIIGLAEISDSPQKVVGKIFNFEGNEKFKFTEKINKDIQIEDLYFYLKFNNDFQLQLSKNPSLSNYIRKFWIQIKTGLSTKRIPNILSLSNNSLAILCDFPPKPIEISLCTTSENGEEVSLTSFTTKHYKYENTYFLASFQKIISRMMTEQMQRIEKAEKDNQQRKVRQIQQEQKVKREYVTDRLQTESYIDYQFDEEDCIGNISIVLSEGYDVS